MSKLTSNQRDALPKKGFAEPEKRAYPIEDKARARNAKARASQAAHSGRITRAEEARIDKRADRVLVGRGK